MGKRVLVIYRVDFGDVANAGVAKKFDGQWSAFEALDWKVDAVSILNNSVQLNNEPVGRLGASKLKSVMHDFYKFIQEAVDFNKYDLIYIRYGLSFPSFINFLKKAKRQRSQLKILVEFPTYPYDDEWEGLRGQLIKTVDGHYRNKLVGLVDKIVHLGDETELFGIPTILSENGIECLSEISAGNKKDDKPIQLIAVGKWRFWHGLDRLIRGMANYSLLGKNQIVNLIVVGEGEESTKLKNLSAQLKLSDNVKFVGNLVGEPLEELYASSSCGIGTLGIFRKKLLVDSSLKHREYACKGLPFILSTEDRDFPESCGFVQYHPEGEEPIDLVGVVSFIEKTRRISPTEIKTYATEKLNWKTKMQEIISQIG